MLLAPTEFFLNPHCTRNSARGATHTFRVAAKSSCLLVTLVLLLLVAVHGDEDYNEPSCESHLDDFQEKHVRATSLLQVNRPPRHGSQALARQQLAAAASNLAAAAAADTFSSEGESDTWLQPSIGNGIQLSQEAFGPAGAAGLEIASGSASHEQVSKLMHFAAEGAEKAQESVTSDASKDAQTAQAMEDVHRNSQEARAAHDLEAKKMAEADQALDGALQRVQQAGQVERQELSMKTVATRRLQEAARGARQVQALEDEGVAREAKAAALLQEAMTKMESLDASSSPKRETFEMLEEAQRLVAAGSYSKGHASQLLQTSLEGAATAVEALKDGEEVQTTKWLRDAFQNLQLMQSSLRQSTDADEKAARYLEVAEGSSNSAKKLAEEASSSKKSVAALLEDVVKKVHSAEDLATQKEALAADAAEQEAEVRQAQKTSQTARVAQMQEEVEAREVQKASQTGQMAQLSSYLQGLTQNVKASKDGQMAQMMQQLSQARGQEAQQFGFQPTQQMNYMQNVASSPVEQYSGFSPLQLAQAKISRGQEAQQFGSQPVQQMNYMQSVDSLPFEQYTGAPGPVPLGSPYAQPRQLGSPYAQPRWPAR